MIIRAPTSCTRNVTKTSTTVGNKCAEKNAVVQVEEASHDAMEEGKLGDAGKDSSTSLTST